MSESKAILLSIRPQYVALIESGGKTYELRRKRPKIQCGDLALVYESSPTKSMVGAFIVGEVLAMPAELLWSRVGDQTGISKKAFDAYFDGSPYACAIQICRYWPLQSRVGLKQLRSRVKIEPPQSYRYLCEKQTGKIFGSQALADFEPL
jgi:predicted transcriptional regulator